MFLKLTVLLILLHKSTFLFFVRSNKDQLILSVLLSSLLMDVLYLVVDWQTFHYVWHTLASPSNFHIMQLHRSFQNLRQGDASVAMHMQQEKSLFYELVVAGRPISLEDFNLYVFRGLRGEFKDLVTSFATKAEPLSYADVHSHLITHEFLHKTSLQSMIVNPPLLPPLPLLPSAILAQYRTTLASAVTEVVFLTSPFSRSTHQS
jgi:hypothetical protein